PFAFFFNPTSPPSIYTLSLHDALPIYFLLRQRNPRALRDELVRWFADRSGPRLGIRNVVPGLVRRRHHQRHQHQSTVAGNLRFYGPHAVERGPHRTAELPPLYQLRHHHYDR